MNLFNVIKASSIPGVVLDCDVDTGLTASGGAATDNTATINQALLSFAAVGAGSVKLILDGGSLVSGLTLPSVGNYEIEGIGWTSGIFMKAGSNSDAINNGVFAFQPTGSPPAQGGSIKLRNFKINGNRGNGTSGNSTSGIPQGVTGTYWYCNITLYGVNGVHIEDMFLFDAPAYSIRLTNCSNLFIKNNYIFNPNVTTTFNQDCIHLNAPITDAHIEGNTLNNNFSDDGVALNAPEGYPNTIIDRVAIIGNTYVGTLTALRAYGEIEAQVGSVAFSNNAGNVKEAVILLGADGVSSSAGDACCRLLTTSNNSFVTAGTWLELIGNSGDIILDDAVWLSPSASSSFILCSTQGCTVSSIRIKGEIYRTTTGNTTTTPLLSASSALTLERLVIDGFAAINEQGETYAAIPEALAMTNISIAQLIVNAIDYTNIALLADSYTNIGSISGAWQQRLPISKTAAYTLLPTDRTVLANTTSAAFAVTLPAKSFAGEKHTIKNIGTANTLTVTGTVDGTANPTLASLAKLTVESDGTNFWSV
jgi:hypothetical protein